MKVMVANKNIEEGRDWQKQMIEAGYSTTSVCQDLSAFVNALARENIQIVICSVNLIDKNAFALLTSIIEFFPRIKIVVVGTMSNEAKLQILNHLKGVVIINAFRADIEAYWKEPSQILAGEETCLSLLLDEHFLTSEEARLMLERTMPGCVPDFVVICVLTESGNRAFEVISETIFGKENICAVRLRFNEICVILDASPDDGRCFDVADSIRHMLLERTDTSFSIGISRLRNEAAELYVCRKEALRAALADYIYGCDSVIHINYLFENDIEFTYPEHKEKRLVEQTMDGNKQEALNMLFEIFQILKEGNYRSQSLINKIALGIIIRLNIAAVSRAEVLEAAQMEPMSTRKLLSAKTTDEAYLILKNGIESFSDEMDALMDLRRDALYLQMLKMKEGKAELSISELLRTFHTTINFLNSAVARNDEGSIFDFL